MNIHIQCLSLLVILLTLNPLSIAQLIACMKKNNSKEESIKFIRNLTFIYFLIIPLIFIFFPESLIFNMPKNKIWLFIAFLSSFFVIAVEMLIAYIILRIKGEDFTGVEVNNQWMKCGLKVSIYTILIGVLEEIIYRQVWFFLIVNILNLNIFVFIIASSIFYSLNHSTFGRNVVLQKFISGIIFSLLFYFSGISIIIPIVCHGLQNLFVVIRGNINECKV